MASTSELGNAKQLAGFEDFVTQLMALGTAYSPPKPELILANLQAQLTAGKAAMREISTTSPLYSIAVDNQELAFKSLNDKVTRSLNYFKVCVTNPEEIETAKSLADKIRGFNKKPKATTEPDAPETKTISRSQMSYDNRIENLKQYIDVLTASGVYVNPRNEIEIADFTVLLSEMEDTNRIVAETKLPLEVARSKRDLVFYTAVTGIAALVTNIKSYLKATLSKDNPYYDGLLGFAFRAQA
ncbi:hypothetical protein [Pedobacter mucosus]|uniref:hypothetical protein n=1 Tax=Pedobacter mucosus TaxID=2895286 RepID=UPI001EE45086|nr:hypothetical protein [Pedobacter mucosus]UKT64499.1 hypothetical protein LOK61_01675 [Pedobacter mucosus]